MEAVQAVFDYLREINLASTAVRMALALLCGGVIGLAREYKRRPAGFRTHMLVCLGAAMTMLLSQYLHLMVHTRWAAVFAEVGAQVDVSRFGAQVISGIGFLGAGTIIVTGRQEVRELTTAAGLWAAACMGLALGAGFLEGALVGFLLILLCIKVFPTVEARVLANARTVNLYLEYTSVSDLGAIVTSIKSIQAELLSVDVDRDPSGVRRPSAVVSVHLPKQHGHAQLLSALTGLSCVHLLEEI